MSIRSLFVIVCITVAEAQTFVQVTDVSNPIVTTTGAGADSYAGAAWVDYDNDGDIDLFVCPDHLYRNNGSGAFSEVMKHGIGVGLPHIPANGITWADMDNDGDVDCFYSGPRSVLYRNNGKDSNFTFTPVTRGDIGSLNNRGWAGAWGDFDNDGFVDLIITHPRGFVGSAIKNPFFRNLGAGEFSRITAGDVVKDLAPYTVATWYDFDLDGDEDLFIGSGPATAVPAKDYLFKNVLKETGTVSLQRMTEGIIATEGVDGQVWNWIDFDNDGDLDAYLTNFSAVPQNNLYRNDQGVYKKMTVDDVGPIVSSNNYSLANIWVDFDNDGDLDCFITRDESRKCVYYSNNGNGTFHTVDSVPMVKKNGPHIGAAAGDYDNDGDMDLFVISGTSSHELYRNEQSSANNWIKVQVNGYPLNRSAIGAKVKVKAFINGRSFWQFREISAQNSFNGHNSLTAHVGLGDATVIDSLVVEWLSGSRTVMTNVQSKQSLIITENSAPSYLRAVFFGDQVVDQVPFTVNFTDLSFGDSSSHPVSWKWDLNGDGVTDATTQHAQFNYTAADSYSVQLIVSDGIKSDTLIRKDYIIAQQSTPLIGFNTDQHHFGTIDVNMAKKETLLTVYNLGKGTDSISVSIVYGVTTFGTVKPDSALSFTPKSFLLAGRDSQQISYVFYPGSIIRTLPTITYTPKIIITSKNNNGTKIFEKNLYFRLSGTLMDVQNINDVPETFLLAQNYPNPFNPATTIGYQLPENCHVLLKLYDALGREIVTLVNEEQTAGDHTHQLHAEHLASGIYFYMLDAGPYHSVKQLQLIK
ncbi:MAG: FG-GAP-like repeat-containing protein [Bacteroidota bacterium]